MYEEVKINIGSYYFISVGKDDCGICISVVVRGNDALISVVREFNIAYI